MLKTCLYTFLFFNLISCADFSREADTSKDSLSNSGLIKYANGLKLQKKAHGVTIIEVKSPWPDSREVFRYALVPKDSITVANLDPDAFDALISVPVQKVVVTSTTHIPALEALGVGDRIVGFPDARYISSSKTRVRVDEGDIVDLGNNEALNTEMVLELQPDLVIGFAVSNRNKAYDVLEQSGIPVVYNSDWTEESPLGKAEWIKFFAPFFGLENRADSLFRQVETNYTQAKALAAEAADFPTVLSGALYKDVWYLPGGKSWAAQFLDDAHAAYLWRDNKNVGSLSLSLESVLERAVEADYWIGPAQYTSYEAMKQANQHYSRFKAFRNKKVYTYARTRGTTGGYEYYELAPNRPDLVLKDLIHLLHPGLLPNYTPYFFKPLK